MATFISIHQLWLPLIYNDISMVEQPPMNYPSMNYPHNPPEINQEHHRSKWWNFQQAMFDHSSHREEMPRI